MNTHTGKAREQLEEALKKVCPGADTAIRITAFMAALDAYVEAKIAEQSAAPVIGIVKSEDVELVVG